MITYLETGNWPDGSIRLSWVESSRPVIGEVEDAIDRAWNAARGRSLQVQLFDGPMCRLESYEAMGDALVLRLSRTSYRTFFGTNMSNPTLAERYGPNVLANPVGLSAALVTADAFLVFGRRNATVAYYPNRVHPFAGALEPREQLDVFDDVRRELREELALPFDEILDLRCVGLVEDHALRQPELIFTARTPRSRAQLEESVDVTEHGGAWSIPATRADIERSLKDLTPFTPVAIATMTLLAGCVPSGRI
jgi:hypothetical protein